MRSQRQPAVLLVCDPKDSRFIKASHWKMFCTVLKLCDGNHMDLVEGASSVWCKLFVLLSSWDFFHCFFQFVCRLWLVSTPTWRFCLISDTTRRNCLTSQKLVNSQIVKCKFCFCCFPWPSSFNFREHILWKEESTRWIVYYGAFFVWMLQCEYHTGVEPTLDSCLVCMGNNCKRC